MGPRHARIQELFQGGGGVQARCPESSLDKVVFLFFSPQLILQFTGGSNGFITEITILFQGSRGGPTFSRGVQLFRGGQASKYLKICTCPASINLLAYMGKV